MKEVAILLHNIRSAHNVGSIFRTADAAGLSRVYMSGYTPQPVDRFGRPQKEILKTALGAETSLPWEFSKNPRAIIDRLSHEGWQIVGLEQDDRSISYREYTPAEKTLYIVGNEVRGISAQMRRLCDVLIEIPMSGTKESLNVAVATGIALFGGRDH